MSHRPVVFEVRRVFAAAVVVVSLAATQSLLAAPQAKAINRPLSGFDAAAVDRAKEGAKQKLQEAECRRILTDFKDREGRPLQESLDKWGVSAAEYLQMIPFLDGASQKACRWSKVDLVTTPGTPRVLVCAQFATTQVRDPWLAEDIVIHEMLHTLGLGENPPTSTEITKRVKGRCLAGPRNVGNAQR
jgi:hypothetical protein